MKKQFNLDYNIRPSNLGLENSKVIYLIHGFGADKNDLFSFANHIPVSFTVIAIQAPIELPFGGRAWYNIDFEGEKHVSDTNQAKKSVHEIEQFIKSSVKEYSLDSKNIFVLGFSQGAILSYSMVFNNPSKYKYVLPLSGFIMEEIMPKDYDKDYSHLEFYSAHGIDDAIIPIDKGRTAKYLLEKLNIKHVYNEFPMAHSISQVEFDEIISWLKKRS